MTAVTIPGRGFEHPHVAHGLFTAPVRITIANTIDATGEKLAFVGRMWWPDKASHAVRTFGWNAGTIVSAGGSGITISLQDVDATTGNPSQPDGTQDQTVGVLLSALTANAWNENTFTVDRTVAHGAPLAVVLEFDGAGRLGADSLAMLNFSVDVDPNEWGCVPLLFTASWVQSGSGAAMLLKAADGTIGTLGRAVPASSVTTHTLDSGTTPDEIANQVKFNVPVTLEGVELIVGNTVDGSDFSVILYEGTTAIETLSIDEDVGPVGTNFVRKRPFFFETPRALAANTVYRIAIRPDTLNDITLYSLNVNTAAYLGLLAGADFHYWDRTDAGAWSNETTTRWIPMRLLLSQVSDGGGGGGAFPFIG